MTPVEPPSLAEMLHTGRARGRSGRVFDGLGALSTPGNLAVLQGLMATEKPQRTLEVGLSYGGSCLVFCAMHKALGRSPQGQHVALDPAQTSVWDDAGLLAVERDGLAGFLDFRPAYSASELAKLWSERQRFGLIYVDGSHLFEDVFVDAYFAVRLLEDQGIVVFDDCADPHVAKVIAFLRATLAGSLREVDVAAYRGDGGRSLRYVVGGLIGRRQLRAFRRCGAPERPWDAPFRAF